MQAFAIIENRHFEERDLFLSFTIRVLDDSIPGGFADVTGGVLVPIGDPGSMRAAVVRGAVQAVEASELDITLDPYDLTVDAFARGAAEPSS